MKNCLILFLAWCLPGLGQVLKGYFWHGLLIFILILSIYMAGMGMADFQSISIFQQPFYSFCHIGVPIFWLFSSLFFTQHTSIVFMDGYEMGMAYSCTAGILNIILLVYLCDDVCENEQGLEDV